MKVKTIKRFTDLVEDIVREDDDIFEVTEKRFSQIENLVEEIIDDNKKDKINEQEEVKAEKDVSSENKNTIKEDALKVDDELDIKKDEVDNKNTDKKKAK